MKTASQKSTLILIAIILIGALLRLYNVGHWLRFTGDEARDALAALQIAQGNSFPILGPKVHIGFGFLGPAYYYLLALPLALTNGDPASAGWLVALVDTATIALVYLTAKTLFNTRTALIASAIYAVSFTIVFYARWGWHPSLVPFFTLLVIYCCLKVADQTPSYLPLLGLAFSLGLQMHLSVALLIVPIALALWTGRHALPKPLILFALALMVYPFLPMVSYEISEGYPNLKGLLGLADHKTNEAIRNPFPYLLDSFQTVMAGEVVHKNIPLLGEIATLIRWLNPLLVLVGIIITFRQPPSRTHIPILISWAILPPLVMTAYSGERPDYYLITWFAVPILFVAYAIAQASIRQLAILTLVAILTINLASNLSYFRFMQSLDTQYSYFHANPLGQKKALATAINDAQPESLLFITYEWPNHIPFDYLLDPAPSTMHLYEWKPEANTHQPHWLSGNPIGCPPMPALLIHEPATVPMPPNFTDTTPLTTIGETTLYQLNSCQ